MDHYKRDMSPNHCNVTAITESIKSYMSHCLNVASYDRMIVLIFRTIELLLNLFFG